jgi:hypothetical protein
VSGGAHEPRKAMASASLTALLQPPMHLRRAMGLTAFLMRLFAGRPQRGIGLRA